jgi:peptide chain release factor 3
MALNVPTKLPVHKACWVKPEDTKSDEFKNLRRIKQST